MGDSGGGRVRYQEIAEEIRKRIRHGELRPGDRIPGLREIREQYGVANATAQNAVGLLKTWGLVKGKSGAGTYVRAHRPIVNVMTSMTIAGQNGERRTWKDIAADEGISGSQRVTEAGLTVPPVDVADALGVEIGVAVTWRQRLLVMDERPVQIVTSYFPAFRTG